MRFYMRGFGMTTATIRWCMRGNSKRADIAAADAPLQTRGRMSLDVPPAAGT